jgi:hypothetical protein
VKTCLFFWGRWMGEGVSFPPTLLAVTAPESSPQYIVGNVIKSDKKNIYIYTQIYIYCWNILYLQEIRVEGCRTIY